MRFLFRHYCGIEPTRGRNPTREGSVLFLNVRLFALLCLLLCSTCLAKDTVISDRDGVKLTFAPCSHGSGLYYIFFDGTGTSLKPEESRAFISSLESIASNSGIEWPKSTAIGRYRVSYKPGAEFPYHIGRRRRHDYTVRAWLKKDELDKLIALCREHYSDQ